MSEATNEELRILNDELTTLRARIDGLENELSDDWRARKELDAVVFDQSMKLKSLRADLDRVTRERDQLYEERDQDFLAKKELDSLLFARTQELKNCTRERDALKEQLDCHIDILKQIQRERDSLIELCFEEAIATDNPETCKCNRNGKYGGWRLDNGKIICTNCFKPVALAVVKPETCKNCNGTGSAAWEECDECQGTGIALAEQKEEKSDVCVWELTKDNPEWCIYKTSCGKYMRSIGKPIRLCVCGRPIEQKEV